MLSKFEVLPTQFLQDCTAPGYGLGLSKELNTIHHHRSRGCPVFFEQGNVHLLKRPWTHQLKFRWGPCTMIQISNIYVGLYENKKVSRGCTIQQSKNQGFWNWFSLDFWIETETSSWLCYAAAVVFACVLLVLRPRLCQLSFTFASTAGWLFSSNWEKLLNAEKSPHPVKT